MVNKEKAITYQRIYNTTLDIFLIDEVMILEKLLSARILNMM